MNNPLKNQKGSVLLLFAMVLLGLLGLAKLTVDFGYVAVQKARLQSTADAAALACVIDKQNNCSSGGVVNSVYNFTLTPMSVSDANCPLSTQTQCAIANATTTWQPFMFLDPVTLTATAIAGTNGIAACFASISDFVINGSAPLLTTNCSVAVGGKLNANNQTGITLTASAPVTLSSLATTVYNNNFANSTIGVSTPTPVGSSGPLPSLPSYPAPTGLAVDPAVIPAACTGNGNNKVCTTPITYSPGIYTSKVTLSKTDPNQFKTGSYVFNGGLDTNAATLTDDNNGGVAIYVPGNKSLKLDGTITLKAIQPANCNTAAGIGTAILISHPNDPLYTWPTLTLAGGTNTLNLEGVLNLTSDDVVVSGTSSTFKLKGSFIAKSLTINGNMVPDTSGQICNYININKPKLLN